MRKQEARVGCDMKGLGSISIGGLLNWLVVSKLLVAAVPPGSLVTFPHFEVLIQPRFDSFRPALNRSDDVCFKVSLE